MTVHSVKYGTFEHVTKIFLGSNDDISYYSW